MKSLISLVILALVLVRTKRKRNRISNVCLPLQQASAWNKLWTSQDDNGLIHMTGFDRFTFFIIHNTIAPHLYSYQQGHGGRPSRLDTMATTALALYYLNGTTPIKSLCQIFAAPTSTIQRALLRALVAIERHITKVYEARIEWPSESEMQYYSKLVNERESTLTNIFGFVDGLWLPILEPGDSDTQNAYYNGWKSCHNISNVIVWAPDGTILWARYNCPGSWHDYNVSHPLLEMLDNPSTTPQPYQLLADSAFTKSPKIRTPSGVTSSDPVIASIQLQAHKAVTSTRQAAEWGMRVLQGTFQRLKLCLPSNCTLRRIIIADILHLSNLRARVMGINQIRTVFDSSYVPTVFSNKDARKIHQYYQL